MAVAIDGNRLAIRKEKINNNSNLQFIVSARAISEAVKIIGENDEDIIIRVGDRNISFDIDGYVMTSRLLEGKYIEYSRSIPESYTQEIKINVDEMVEIIEITICTSINNSTILITEPINKNSEANKSTTFTLFIVSTPFCRYYIINSMFFSNEIFGLRRI